MGRLVFWGIALILAFSRPPSPGFHLRRGYDGRVGGSSRRRNGRRTFLVLRMRVWRMQSRSRRNGEVSFFWARPHPGLLALGEGIKFAGKAALRGIVRKPGRSFADDFDQDPFAAPAVEFAVVNLFPRPEIQRAFGDGHDHFAAHDLAFDVRVGVVLARPVVMVL